MLIFEKVKVFNFEGAMRGLRNPKDSWHLSDSIFDDNECCHPNPESITDCRTCELFQGFGESCIPYIGPKDMKLAQAMIGAGTDESKFLRQIFITMDITAPLYWWKEFDTYKVGTVANSCSTMHKIHEKEFTIDDFSHEHLLQDEFDIYAPANVLHTIIVALNFHREQFKKTTEKKNWYQMIQLLPSSYNQLATVKLNYAVLRNMYHSRKNHKLDEWSQGFTKWVESLPYSELITEGG